MKPLITHDFKHPSDEEIVPNPTSTFSKTILPHFGQIRSWFKAGLGQSKKVMNQERRPEQQHLAFLLPLAMAPFSDGDIFAHTYENIATKLP